jgi:DNA-binding response OmpR family regulator
MTRVLVVEDDPATAAAISSLLQDHGCSVASVDTGRQAVVQAMSDEFDVIILDRMLPGGLDGLGVLTAVRSAGVQTPVLFLSALSDLDERVRGLRAGGDDYLSKPFDSLELAARVEALSRRRARGPEQGVSRIRIGELELDPLKRAVCRGDRKIDLLPREYAVLAYLMEHSGQVVTRTMLFEAVWNYRSDERTNVIEVHVGRLRRKIDAEGEPAMIHTVRGAGYVLRAP